MGSHAQSDLSFAQQDIALVAFAFVDDELRLAVHHFDVTKCPRERVVDVFAEHLDLGIGEYETHIGQGQFATLEAFEIRALASNIVKLRDDAFIRQQIDAMHVLSSIVCSLSGTALERHGKCRR